MPLGPALLSLASLLACGCAVNSTRAEVAAVLIAPDEAGRAELRRFISTALGGAPVTVGADALTRTNLLFIERGTARDSSGLPLNGRRLGPPATFELVLAKGACVLKFEAQRFVLTACRCVPLPPAAATGLISTAPPVRG